MTYRFILLILPLILFQISCQRPSNDVALLSIDLQTSPDTLTLFGENIISTPLYERDMAISPRQDELIFTLADYKQSRRCLVALRKKDGDWSVPEVLNISGHFQDIEPFYAQNGNRLYFASNRPIFGDSARNDFNIWYSDKTNGAWSEPVPLVTIINTRGDEFFPSLSKNGNLYFTATRENGPGREDIFFSAFVNGQYQNPVPLPEEINTTFYEFNAFISPQEDYIIFSSYGRDDGIGGGDLYMSEKDDAGHWIKARNLGEKINSDKLDYCPFVDADSRNFYFTSERTKTFTYKLESADDLRRIANSVENGFGNIYTIAFSALNIKAD